jgi:hypothetical protein
MGCLREGAGCDPAGDLGRQGRVLGDVEQGLCAGLIIGGVGPGGIEGGWRGMDPQGCGGCECGCGVPAAELEEAWEVEWGIDGAGGVVCGQDAEGQVGAVDAHQGRQGEEGLSGGVTGGDEAEGADIGPA